jgi:miniconductance mechanosensitive channel
MNELETNLEKSSNFISRYSYDMLLKWGVSKDYAELTNCLVLLGLLVILVFVVHGITRAILRFILARLERIKKMKFFMYLTFHRFAHFFALIAPVSLVRAGIPIVFENFPAWIKPLQFITDVYSVFMMVSIVTAFVRALIDTFKEKNEVFRYRPMESYIQVLSIILYFFGAIFVYVRVTGDDPLAFFGVIGATSAILLLVFQDTIKGFVASIQVTTNDMVRIGDWVTMPKYGADGDVLEINLTTVKVQNFDKTITTIPTYALISDSFQNWRGMQMSGGRRIKRTITVKQSSIRFLEDHELEVFKRIQGIAGYIDKRQKEIDEYNKRLGLDRSLRVNGRNLTNAGLFRQYIEWYLLAHPGINKDMSLMVRQLAPSNKGLPFELYTFTNTVKWADYENIMSDIFDHLISSVKFFDLQIFEDVAGSDADALKLENPIWKNLPFNNPPKADPAEEK